MNSLYSTYRPQDFNQLIGQDIIKQILLNSIRNNEINHAYLLNGVHGTGKTTMARIFSKAINCNSKVDLNPCNKCDSCNAINSNSSLNVFEFDAASNNGVDEIRDLTDKANYLVQGNYKVYIIDEVHMLSKAAFNALLKTLEEPPKNTVFILLTTELKKIPDTIISRCLMLNLETITADQIKKGIETILINEKKEFESSAIDYIALYSKGSLRDSITMLQTALLYENKLTVDSICKILKVIKKEDIINVFNNKGEEFVKLIDNKALDIILMSKIIIESLLEITKLNRDNSIIRFLSLIIEASFKVNDPDLLRIYIKNSYLEIFMRNVSRETSNVQNEPILVKEEVISHIEKKEAPISLETKTETPKEETIIEVIQKETIQPNLDPRFSFNKEYNDEQTTEFQINKLKENELNVSRETSKSSNGVFGKVNTTSITDYIDIKHYLTVMQNNNIELLAHYNQKWLKLDNFSNTEYSKYLKIITEAEKLLAATDHSLILGFSDELPVNEFKKISLDKDFYVFLEKALGKRIVILPVHQANWKVVRAQYDSKIANSNVKLKSVLDIDAILGDIEKSNDIGKELFGDKLLA